MDLDFPYRVATNGRTAITDKADHVRDLIKQVLFTSPGERVNNPTFGSGLNQLVFESNSVEMISTVQFLVKGALHQWLSEIIEVVEVNIEIVDSSLSIQVIYSEIGSPTILEAAFDKSI